MALALAVAEPFGRHMRGDLIEDPAEVEAVLRSHAAAFVRRVQLETPPLQPAQKAED